MLDEQLRALERATDTASRIRYAEALVRLGRASDALAALLRARDDPDARRALGRLTVPRDVPTKTPRVFWTARSNHERVEELVGSPLVVAVTCNDYPREDTHGFRNVRTRILDATTGALRAEVSDHYARAIAGDVVVASEIGATGIVRAFDAWTGERLWEHPFERSPFKVVRGRLAALTSGQVVSELALDDPRRPPVADGRSLVKWWEALVNPGGRPWKARTFEAKTIHDGGFFAVDRHRKVLLHDGWPDAVAISEDAIVYATRGAVIAKRPSGELLWEQRPVEGDARIDALALSGARVFGACAGGPIFALE